MILGLWVMADGVIYDIFNNDPDIHGGMVVTEIPSIRKWWIAADYGTSNATTFILCGLGEDGRLYVVNEYYHSGAESGRQKSPQQYSAEFTKWLDQCAMITGGNVAYDRFFIDPSAEAFIVQLWSDGIKRTAKADNEVKAGIELVSTIMGADKFRVHARCKNVLRELTSYVWDPKAQKRGEDAPLKQNDHCLDPIRYIANGTRQLWVHRKSA
jgi:PBSX family phage terminase large subunit